MHLERDPRTILEELAKNKNVEEYLDAIWELRYPKRNMPKSVGNWPFIRREWNEHS